MLVKERISYYSSLWSREGGAGKVGRGGCVGLVKPCRERDFDPGQTSPFASWGRSQEIYHAHEIVGCCGPGEHPSHSFQASKPRLAHQGHGLEPAEDFFHSLAFPLAHRVARVPGGALINRTAARPSRVLRPMGRDLQLTQRGDLLASVIILVASQSEAPSLPLALGPDHLQRRPAAGNASARPRLRSRSRP